jgi:hypothetical protein
MIMLITVNGYLLFIIRLLLIGTWSDHPRKNAISRVEWDALD